MKAYSARLRLPSFALVMAVTLALFTGQPAWAQAAPDDQPYISEVSPAANANQPAWVELTVGRVQPAAPPLNTIFLPVIQSPSTNVAAASTGQTTTPLAGATLRGWRLSDEDGNEYTLPQTLGDLPRGSRVVIYFDGQGPTGDDLDAGDGSVHLHSPAGLIDIFEPTGDQLALHDDTGALVDFVAWGQDPGADADEAVRLGRWQPGVFVIYDQGFGAGSELSPSKPGASIGIFQYDPAVNLKNWLPYGSGDSTPGQLNPPPAPLHSTIPPDGAFDSSNFGIAWSGLDADTQYEFELATDADFADVQVQKLMDKPSWRPEAQLSDGDYFWRVRALGVNGNFSKYLGPFKVSLVDLTQFTSLGTRKTLLKPEEYKLQHKDSTMLDIGGGPNNIVGANNAGDRRYPKDRNWDGEHVDANNVPRFGWNGIDNWYCVRASTAMINDYYGGNLSQDRISYYTFEEQVANGSALKGVPEHDLGFGSGIGAYATQEKVLGWALGTNITAVNYCPQVADPDYNCPNPAGSPMSFADVKSLIDSGKPFMSINLKNQHARVVDGYWEISANSRWVHLIDPVPADTNTCPTCTNAQWLSYTTFANTHERALYAAGAVTPRNDEASIHTDSDGDGINDFDEINRFHTDRYNADSDGDWVNDKNDMAEYIFDKSNVGVYIYTPGMAPQTADFDGDGLRKELDWDNDNDGAPDGCEDVDVDGEYDPPTETSNFNKNAKQICQPRFAIVNPVSGQATNAGDPTNPDKVLIRLSVALPPALPNKPTFTAAQFSATIGGLDAPTISGAQVGQEFWLLVQAPDQTEAKFYDLAVDFAGSATGHQNQSDSEVNAVYYIPRPRMDTVVVLDTSGSMNDFNKLASAKNAARLYIDQWAENDRIGLVTFADNANLAAPLTPIPASLQVLTDTKNLLNALTANGATALGAGLQLGQEQLTSLGGADHDQSLMLLSDGQENQTPYWNDPVVSGVIIPSKTVVNTIGFGPNNATWFGLLQQIAGATGGTFGAVDEPSAINAAAATALNATFPSTPENRLADAYKYAAEQILGEQRLYEASGVVSRENKTATHRFFVGTAPSLVVSANFAVPNQAAIDLFSPDGVQIKRDDAGVDYRHDPTHEQYRIATPQAGLWRVEIRWVASPLIGPGGAEYLLFAAADSALTMNFIVGEATATGLVVGGGTVHTAPLVAIVADSAPVLGANVVVDVLQATGEPGAPITLLDDGQHGDGAADDGIYGGEFIFALPGTYQLKAKATGVDNHGDNFERHAQGWLTLFR